MGKRKIAVIGIGKIARDQHLKVIGKSADFTLAACVSPHGEAFEGMPLFRSAAELYLAMPEIDLVAICTPPSVRHGLAREALEHGKDVLLEKPPTPTLSELADLKAYARKKNLVLFQTWHSRYNAAVDKARTLLRKHGVQSARIDWRESVRKWHPGQDWVWEAGGFGVCDPGINALSIFTRIMPFPVFVESAVLQFPANRQSPVDAQIVFKSNEPHAPQLSAGFNWLEESGEIWTITIQTLDGNEIRLESGGTVLKVNGRTRVEGRSEEYERIYEHFAALLRKGKSEVDDTPLRLTADAFLLASRHNVDEFYW